MSTIPSQPAADCAPISIFSRGGLFLFCAGPGSARGAGARRLSSLSRWSSRPCCSFYCCWAMPRMGFWLDRQHPVSAQGLPRRTGWPGEAGLGLAVGWALAVACVLPMVVGGGIAIVLVLGPSAWGWLLADAAFFALVALAEEVAFRGYGFQRFERAVGPLGAALGFAAFYAIVQALAARFEPRQRRCFNCVQPCALHCLSAHSRTLGELGNQLWLEGQPRIALRAGHQRRQQPLPCGAGQSDGAVLAHWRRLWPGRQLGGLRSLLARCPWFTGSRANWTTATTRR